MKKVIISLLLSLTGNMLIAQEVPYNVVFDVTSQDTAIHQTVIRWIGGITKEHPDARIEVVFYGKSLDMITQNKSVVANDVNNYAYSKNVTFTVCEAAMKRNNVAANQLLTGVRTVPDGIYQIIKRQHEGWGYIKVAK